MEHVLTPCFMISLAWLATSFTMLRAAAWTAKIKHEWFFQFTDRPGTKQRWVMSNLACLYNPLSLLGGSSGNLEKNKEPWVYFVKNKVLMMHICPQLQDKKQQKTAQKNKERMLTQGKCAKSEKFLSWPARETLMWTKTGYIDTQDNSCTFSQEITWYKISLLSVCIMSNRRDS